MTEPTPDLDTLRLVHSEMNDRAARQAANIDRVDTKATTLLGFVLAAATFFASQSVEPVTATLAYIAFAISSGYGISAMRPKRFKETPEPKALMELVAPRGEAAALALLSAAKRKTIEDNRTIHEKKAKHWNHSLVVLIVAIALAVPALLIGDGSDAQRREHHPSSGPSARP